MPRPIQQLFPLLLSLLLPFVLWACGSDKETEQPSADAGKLNIYNWVEYIPDGMIDAFEEQTGIEVVYDTFESNEALQAKLVAGNTGYDIVVPSISFAQGQRDAGFFQPLDKSKLSNLQNLNPTFYATIEAADPDNNYFIPWAWSYTTVGINKTLVDKTLGNTPMPKDAWDLVFNPQYTSKLASCGIAYLDSPTEIFPVALHYVGKPAFSNNPDDFAVAGDMLAKVHDDLRYFSSTLIDDLASRRACVVLGWAGDINWSAEVAEENGFDDEIVALIPASGGLLFTDVMAIPADAKNVDNALRFINWYLEPENSAWVMNEVNYSTGNDPAMEFVDEELKANKTIFVSDEDLQNMVPPGNYTNATREALGTAYNNFKAGR